MVQFVLERDGGIPLYRQIVIQLRDRIRSGALQPGHRLPPVRSVAAQYGITRLTVHNAYAELQAQGLVESHVGRGTYVASGASPVPQTTSARPPQPWVSQGVLAELLRVGELRDVISFAQAFPAPETYPAREFGRALHHALKEPSAFNYGPIQGEPDLREQIADLLQDRGLAAPPENMLITSGAQQGCDLALRALVEPGDVVVTEEPTYPGMLELAALRGQRIVGVQGDDGGISVEALEAACSAFHPRALYLIPTYNNPTGRLLAADRRESVLRLAREHDMLVIEDDTYGFLGLEGGTPPPLARDDDGDRVVYITSFSKILAPALRLGVLVAPASLLPSLAAVKQSSDLVCSALLQRALADYLRSGHFAAHVQRVRGLYRERRDAMLAALEDHGNGCNWTHPEGGLSLWVRLPDGIDESRFTADALEQGIGIAPGRAFFSQPQNQAAMRLSFGAHSVERIEQGIATLGRLFRSHPQQRFSMLSLAGRGAGPLV